MAVAEEQHRLPRIAGDYAVAAVIPVRARPGDMAHQRQGSRLRRQRALQREHAEQVQRVEVARRARQHQLVARAGLRQAPGLVVGVGLGQRHALVGKRRRLRRLAEQPAEHARALSRPACPPAGKPGWPPSPARSSARR